MTSRRAAGPLTAALLLSTSALGQDAAGSDARTGPDIAVTAVTLATGGLAHVEGTMTAPAETMRLSVERAQVADVLRSLVITGEAPVVSIALPAAEAVGARSQTGRLLLGDLADPATVLGSLIGAEVTLSGGPNTVSGRLLGFDVVTIPGAETTPERPGVRVAVTRENGAVNYATFPSLDSLGIGGPAIATRMQELLPALSESVDDGRRDLTVRLADEAVAGFSFVVPTTVWRPSYRAIVDSDGAVALQGWATLENTTGLDWRDISLSLAVGTPVAYSQDVYSPLRTDRPDAPFSVGQTAKTGIVAPDEARAAQSAGASRSARMQAAPAPMAMAEPAEVVIGAPAEAGSAVSVFPVAGAIDLAAGRTLTVPFLSGATEAERIAYLDLDEDGGQGALDALELAFEPEATVPGGLITVYDRGRFAGDARFAGADGGETRILPFALSATLDARVSERNDRTLTNARFDDGSFIVTREAVRQTTLNIEADRATTLVIDLERRGATGITLETSEGVDATTTRPQWDLTRVRADIRGGASRITVDAARPLSERYVVGDIPQAIVEEVLAVGGRIDPETTQRLRRVAETVARIREIEREIATLEADVADLERAVALDRDNLEAIDVSTPEGAAVRQRIVERTNTIDAKLEELRALRRERDAAQDALRAG